MANAGVGSLFPHMIKLLSFGALLFLLLFVSTASPADITRGNPAARLLSGHSASEHWEFTARFDSGHFFFAEFLITNIGPGERSAAAVGYIIDPDGTPHRFTNGRRKGRWSLSPDRLYLEIGASVLDLHDSTYQLHVNKKAIQVHLRFRPDRPVVWSETVALPGYALDLLALAVPVEGTVWMRGMAKPLPVNGTIVATRSWMNEAGSSLILRRLEFFTLQQKIPLYGLDLLTPDGKRSQWLVIKQPGHPVSEFHNFALSLDGVTNGPQERGYDVPGALRFKNTEVEGRVRLERVLVRTDPFADLPQLFRFLVELTLNLRPRRVWALSPFTVSFRPDQADHSDHSDQPHVPLQVHGTSVTAVTFLNPVLASPSRTAAHVLEVSRAP